MQDTRNRLQPPPERPNPEPPARPKRGIDVITWRTFLKNDDQIRMLFGMPNAVLEEVRFERARNLAWFCTSILEALDKTDNIGIREAMNYGLEIAYRESREQKWAFEHFKASLSGDLKAELEPIACARRAIAYVEAAKAKKASTRHPPADKPPLPAQPAYAMQNAEPEKPHKRQKKPTRKTKR